MKKTVIAIKKSIQFLITDRGVVLLPGLGKNVVKTNTAIRLVRLDGSTIDTKICGVGFNEFHDILLGQEAWKKDVPVGIEVWLIKSIAQPCSSVTNILRPFGSHLPNSSSRGKYCPSRY